MKKENRHFKKMLKLGKLRFYVTWNYRLKNSQQRDNNRNQDDIVTIKEKRWAETNHHCELCGCYIDKFCKAQMHHVLNWWRSPNFELNERNLLLLCRDCHRRIHTEPFIETKMIKAKCEEFGLDYKDYYCV